jgi:hypothetical protein
MMSLEKILAGLFAASLFLVLYSVAYYVRACRRPQEETMGKEISFAFYWSVGAITGSVGASYWFPWYICLAIFVLWYLLSWPVRIVLRFLFAK